MTEHARLTEPDEPRRRYADLPSGFRPERGYLYGGVEGLVPIGQYPQYRGKRGAAWCPLDGPIAPGDAAPFPVRVRMPDGAPAQFSFTEVMGYRIELSMLASLYEVSHQGGWPPGLAPEAWLELAEAEYARAVRG